MVVEPKRRLFSVVEYDRMVEAGILTRSDRVELFDGEIIEMTPIGDRHQGCVDAFTLLFTRALMDMAIVRVQGPAVLDDLSEPEPDICLMRPPLDRYRRAHPRPADLLLIVEVADSSLAHDLNRKTPRYALTGVPETWVVDLNSDRIEVFRGASPNGYLQHLTYVRGQELVVEAFPDIGFDVTEILGPTS